MAWRTKLLVIGKTRDGQAILTRLATRQDGVENRDKVYYLCAIRSRYHDFKSTGASFKRLFSL